MSTLEPREALRKVRDDGMITEDEFATEDGRLLKAQTAGRELAAFERSNGHSEPRANWDKDGTQNAGAFSHMSAAGFTNFGSRAYSQVFIDAYRKAFEELTAADL